MTKANIEILHFSSSRSREFSTIPWGRLMY